VVFSGTLEWSQGLEQMVKAWRCYNCRIGNCILPVGASDSHTAKAGGKQPQHCFSRVSQPGGKRALLCAAKIGMNPQDVTLIPGTSFAFKIIEYLAAGLHVITTPRGELESQLVAGITISKITLPKPSRLP